MACLGRETAWGRLTCSEISENRRWTYVNINTRRVRLVVSWFDMMINVLTAVGLTTGGSSTVHIYTQTEKQLTA